MYKSPYCRKPVAPTDVREVYSGSANATMLCPTAMATYCLLSNMYVMGEDFHVWFVGKSHRTLAFVASAAMNDPLFSPKNTSPDAVDITPADAVAGVVTCGRSHAISPV